ncbi:MAG TPA: HK97 family phage prohead protease [Tepidisphaeraceae bacterium]|jgi:hypothetical protein|nr:HK97 family phage prohead protease [Tepidisphaeraceae bacterium]
MKNEALKFYTIDTQFAVASTEGKPTTLTGYAIVYNALSDDRGGYRVRIKPGSVSFAKEVQALYYHAHPEVLGTTANGSLRLTSDTFGVKVEIDLPDTQRARDVAELVGKRYVTGMSFAMVSTPKGTFTTEGGQRILNAEAFTIDEVTVTGIPAFVQSNITVKTDDDARFASRRADALRLDQFKLDLYRLPGALPAAV